MSIERFQCGLRNTEKREETNWGQPASCTSIPVGCKNVQFGSDEINKHLVAESSAYDRLLEMISNMKKDADKLRSEVKDLRNENKSTGKKYSSLAATAGRHRLILLGLLLLFICGCALLAVLVGVTKHQLSQLKKRVPNKGMTVEMRNLGHVVWRINGWAERTQSARQGCCEAIFSDPFYTHENGYRMCLSVHPDGDNAGKGTHLSLFFYLLQGPFDNFLSWPFKHNVTLSLIDQRTGIDLVNRIISYDNFPNDTDWNKPTRYRNGGFGSYKMLNMAALSRTLGLIQDDTISIRCVVK